MQTLTIIRPDDMHLHLRDGDTLRHVLPHTARQMGRAVIMPNLKPPVISVADALAYRERILASLPAGSRFQPLMTLYLTDHATPALVQEAGSRHWWTRSTPLPRHIEVLNDMTEVRPGHHRALLLITHRPLDEDLWRQWPEHLIVYRPPEGQGTDERPTPIAGSTISP